MIGMLLANQLLVIKFTQEEINSEDNSFQNGSISFLPEDIKHVCRKYIFQNSFYMLFIDKITNICQKQLLTLNSLK